MNMDIEISEFEKKWLEETPTVLKTVEEAKKFNISKEDLIRESKDYESWEIMRYCTTGGSLDWYIERAFEILKNKQNV